MRSWSALPMMLLLPRCAGLSVSAAVHRPAAVLRPALLASCRVSGHERVRIAVAQAQSQAPAPSYYAPEDAQSQGG